MNRERDLEFYSELVIVTIVSFVAAKAWFEWFGKFIARYVGSSLTIDFLSALILTGAAIFVLHLLFSRKMTKRDMTLPHGLIYPEEEREDI